MGVGVSGNDSILRSEVSSPFKKRRDGVRRVREGRTMRPRRHRGTGLRIRWTKVLRTLDRVVVESRTGSGVGQAGRKPTTGTQAKVSVDLIGRGRVKFILLLSSFTRVNRHKSKRRN